jgi:hypothetical protein
VSRIRLEVAVSILLLVSIGVTGLSGYLQSELELRRFVPHRYAAYATLALTVVHILLSGGKIWRRIRGTIRPTRDRGTRDVRCDR